MVTGFLYNHRNYVPELPRQQLITFELGPELLDSEAVTIFDRLSAVVENVVGIRSPDRNYKIKPITFMAIVTESSEKKQK